jgi:osmoprotectant transport system substrate-binding protein
VDELKKIFMILPVFLLSIFVVTLNSPALAQPKPIIVASKIDTEGALLGQIIILSLESKGLSVTDKTEFGPTNVIRKAIISDEIDIYPEYTGNGGFFFNGTDPNVWKNARKGYETVKKLDDETNKIVWLKPAPANNTWAIAARKDLAKAQNLKTLEDLAKLINKGGRIKLASSEEFISRPDALPSFEKTYGFKLSKEQLVTFSGGNTAQTEQAAANGTDGVNLAMAYGTDGAIAAFGLIVLADNKEVQPIYQPAPIVRSAIYKQYPNLEKILNPIFATLDLETLQTLNAKIVIDGLNAKEVARDYLVVKGFLKK